MANSELELILSERTVELTKAIEQLQIELSERKRAEQGLLLLQTITLSVGQAEDVDSALVVVLRTLCEATGWILGQAWAPNRDGTVLECSSAWHGSGPGLEDFRRLSEGVTFAHGIGLPGRVWASKRPAWVEDVTVDLNFPRVASARKVDLKAAVGIPVLAGDEVVLVMEFFVRELREEDERLVDLISAVAAEIGLVIQRKRAEEALRRKELEYRNLVESIHAIVWRADARTFQFTFVSKEAETLLGYPADQWISDPAFRRDHIHPDDRDWAVSFCVKATEEGRDHEFEYRMIAADGRVVWLRDIVRVAVDDNGVKELVGVMVDITGRKLTEEALRQSEKKFSAIFQTIPDVVSIVRLRDWLVLDMNDAWTAQTGYLKSERVGKTAQELGINTDQGNRERLTERLLEAGAVNNYEATYRFKDGSLHHALTSARVIELDGEQCAVGVTRDITDLKTAEEAIRQSEAKFRTLAETTPSAIVVHRLEEAEILYVNPAMEKISGYSKAELLELTLWDLIHPEYVEIVTQRRLARLRGEPVSSRLELKLVTKSGEARWVDQSVGTIEFEGKAALISTAFDITDRKRAEEALRRSEERYRALVENTPDIIARFDRDCRYLFVNSAIARVSPLKPEDFIGKTLREVVFTQEEASFREEAIGKVFETGSRLETEFELQGLTGIDVYDWRVCPEFDASGNLQSVLSINRNINERKRAEQALHRSEERYRLIVENQTEFIVKWLPDGTRTFVNESYCRYFGIEEEDCIGTSFFPLVALEFHEAIRRKTASLTPEAPEYTEEHLSIVPGGERWQQWTNRGIFDADENLIELLSTGRDITERKRAEQQLELSREQLRALSAHLQSVREEERTTIAREVHDELGQALTGLKMDLSFLQKNLRKAGATGLERLTEKTASMSKLIDATIQTVRKIATDLRPGILDDLGLVAAIEWQAQDFQNRTGITCRFTPGVDDVDLDRDRSTASFRIFQETLTNVARHSGASEVAVTLNHWNDSVALEIRDNGKGISEADISGSKSLGLLGMRERAHLLGGELEISGSPGTGTTVKVRIPLS